MALAAINLQIEQNKFLATLKSTNFDTHTHFTLTSTWVWVWGNALSFICLGSSQEQQTAAVCLS